MSGSMSGAGKFMTRAANMLLRPRNEWRVIKEEPTTYGKTMTGYGTLLAAIPPVAAVAERLLFGRGIARYSENAPLGYVLATNIIWYPVIILNVIITGAVITAIAGRNEPGWFGVRGLKLALYAFTPLFLVCILTIIPGFSSFIYGAILYSIYLLYLGIVSLYEIGRRKAASYAFASFALAALILGTLNTLEYMLESFVAGRIFF